MQPIKSVQAEKFFIAYRVSVGSTDVECWIYIGNQDGILKNPFSVSVQGELPENKLYGQLVQKLYPVCGILIP